MNTLRRSSRASFRQLIADASSRLEVVVSFLALLELVKLRQVDIEQTESFGEIEITPTENFRGDQAEEFELEFDE